MDTFSIISFVFLLVVIVGWFGIFTLNNKRNKIVTAHNVDYVLDGNGADPEFGIGISTADKTVVSWVKSNHLHSLDCEVSVFDIADILEMKVKVGDELVHSESSNSGITRAIVGGVLAGGAGAVVGAVTSKRTSHSETRITSVCVEILQDSAVEPVVSRPVLGNTKNAIKVIDDAEFACELWSLMRSGVPVPPNMTREMLTNVTRYFDAKYKHIVDEDERLHLFSSVLQESVANNTSSAVA